MLDVLIKCYLYAVHQSVSVGLTAGDKDGEQTRRAPHSQEGQLGELAGAVEGKQCDGPSRHLHEPKDHLCQIDVHPKVRNVEGEAIVHQHVHKPGTSANHLIFGETICTINV